MQRTTRSIPLIIGAVLVAAMVVVPAPAGATGIDPGPFPPPPTIDLTEVYISDNSPPDWFENGMVLRVDRSTGDRTLVSDNHFPVGGPDFQAPMGMTVDADGTLLVAEAFEIDINGVRTPAVIRVHPSTGVRTLVSSNTAPAGGPSFVAPYGVAVEADGSILVADPGAFASGNGGLIRVDPVTGARTTLSRNQAPVGGPSFAGPTDVAVAPNGDIYVVDDNGVIRVDPVTGARTQVSANGAPNGQPSFADPKFMTLDPDGDILVSDWGGGNGGRVVRVDPATGVRTTVSRNTAPVGGPSFGLLGDLVVVCGAILVVDVSGGAVVSVDPVTGVRTTLSDNTVSASLPTFGFPFGIAATGPGCLPRR